MANGLVHSIERAAFSKVLDRALTKSEKKSVQ